MAETKKFRIVEISGRQWTPTYVEEWVDIGTWGRIDKATLLIKINKQLGIFPASLKISWNDNFIATQPLQPTDVKYEEQFNFDVTHYTANGKNKLYIKYDYPFTTAFYVDYLYCELEVTGNQYLPPPPSAPEAPDIGTILWYLFLAVIVIILIVAFAYSLPRLAKVAKDIGKELKKL